MERERESSSVAGRNRGVGWGIYFCSNIGIVCLHELSVCISARPGLYQVSAEEMGMKVQTRHISQRGSD